MAPGPACRIQGLGGLRGSQKWCEECEGSKMSTFFCPKPGHAIIQEKSSAPVSSKLDRPPFRINCRAYGHVATFALLTPLLRATKASQPLYAPCRAWSRPAGHQATRTPPARASALRRPDELVLPLGPAPALPRRRCQHGAGSRRQWRSSTPCSAGPGCLTSSSHCSHRGAATRRA